MLDRPFWPVVISFVKGLILLVSRTGAWSDNSPEWAANAAIAEDLCHVVENDGTFWMPYSVFATVFGTLYVSPVTLPCVRNSTLGGEAKGSMPQCGLCRQALRRRWVLLEDGSSGCRL